MTRTEHAQHHLVVWAETTGGGFAPQHSAETAARPEYWAAAQSLVDTGRIARQRMSSTSGHPIWTLRLVQVDRLGANWCFTSQTCAPGEDGRSPVGYEGRSCRFLFVPAGRISAAEAWRTGIRSAAAAGSPRLAGAAGSPQPTGAIGSLGPAVTAGLPPAETVLGVLAAIATGARLLRVPGTPAEVATLIGEVLTMLPHAVASRIVWTTCTLQVPLAEELVVAGTLPEELRLRDLDLGRRLGRLGWSAPYSREQVESELPLPRATALHRLVDAFGHDPLLDAVRASTAASLDELLDEICEQAQPVAEDEVATRLADPRQWQYLRDHPGSTRRWAEQHPDQAMALLNRRRAPRVGDQLRTELIRGTVLPMVPGELWSSPPEPATVGLLREYAPNVRHRAAAVLALRDRGLALTDDEALTAAYRWLRELGLSPWSDRALFPDRAMAIADEISAGGAEATMARQELCRAWTERRDLVFAVVTLDRFWHRGLAKSLLRSAGQGTDPDAFHDLEDLARLAAALTKAASRRRRTQVAGWLHEVLGYLIDQGAEQRAVRWIMYGALPVVPRRRWSPRRNSTLALLAVCDEIGLDADAPPVVNALIAGYRSLASAQRSTARAASPFGQVPGSPIRERLGPNQVTLTLRRLVPTVAAASVPLAAVALLLWYTGWNGSSGEQTVGRTTVIAAANASAGTAAAAGNRAAGNQAGGNQAGTNRDTSRETNQPGAGGAPRTAPGQAPAGQPATAPLAATAAATIPVDIVLPYEGSNGALDDLTDQLRQRIRRQAPSGRHVTGVDVTATAVTCEFGLGYAEKVRTHLAEAQLSELRGATFGQPRCTAGDDSPDPAGTVRIHLVYATG